MSEELGFFQFLYCSIAIACLLVYTFSFKIDNSYASIVLVGILILFIHDYKFKCYFRFIASNGLPAPLLVMVVLLCHLLYNNWINK